MPTPNRMTMPNHFKLGTFSSNCSSGMSVTTIPERWVASWENNLTLARMLDDAGIDFMLPIARWVGYGGQTDFHSEVLETITWATALLALTRRISVIATVHTAANHPVAVAKQIATMDHVGQGRSGLNIVAGWNKPEYEALGLTLPDDHATRYGYAQEWFDIVTALWTRDEPFDWHGAYFDLIRAYSLPHPLQGIPPIVNAAGSGQGREFATRNADFLFTPAIDLTRSVREIADITQQAADISRQVEVLTFSHVVCRPTEAEARDFVQYYAFDHRDEAALDQLIRLQFAHAESFPHDLLAQMRDLFAMGHGGYPLIGTPEQVAAGIVSLHEAGFGGTTLSFVDYNREFPYFRDNVLPILETRGLRQPNG